MVIPYHNSKSIVYISVVKGGGNRRAVVAWEDTTHHKIHLQCGKKFFDASKRGASNDMYYELHRPGLPPVTQRGACGGEE